MLDWWHARQARRLIARLARQRVDLDLSLKIATLYCLLVQVRDETPDDAQHNIATAVPIYLRYRGTIVELMGSFQFVAFGLFVHNGSRDECLQNRRDAAAELLRTLGPDIRIAAFDGGLSYGLVGDETRLSHTVLVPKFDRCFAALLTTEFGHLTDLGTLS